MTTSSILRRCRMLLWMACFLVAGQLGLTPEVHGQPSENAIAIVVHSDVAADDLSFAQLRKIFMGDQQFWSDRKRITLLVRAPEAYERDAVLKHIYEMSEGQFRQYWIAKIFRSEVTSGPKIVYSTEMAHELVRALPGSITFMRATDVGDGMKVLRIDGKAPADPGYPLR